MDTAPSKWKEVSERPLGGSGSEFPYSIHGVNKREESRSASSSSSSSIPRRLSNDNGNNNKSIDVEDIKERGNDRARARRMRMGVISSTEREHFGTSPAGFHIKSTAVVVTIDSNSSNSSSSSSSSGGSFRGRNESDVSRDHGSKDRNCDSRTSSISPKNANINRIKKTSSRASTDDDASVSPVEGASLALGGTGLKVTMKKLSGKMFFAGARDSSSHDSCHDINTSTRAASKENQEEVKVEGEGSKRGVEKGIVSLLEYPLFEMKSDGGSDDVITMSSNVVTPSMSPGGGGGGGTGVVQGKGAGTWNSDSSGAPAPALFAPAIPFRDIFYFNAHLIDIGE